MLVILNNKGTTMTSAAVDYQLSFDHDFLNINFTLCTLLLCLVPWAVPATYIDHSIGSDAEEGGSFVDCLDLLPSLHRDFQALEFTQGTLQGCPMLGDQVITRAKVIELADEYLQGALNLTAVRLGCGLLVP